MKFSIKESVKKGWELTKKNLVFLIGVVIIVALVNFLPNMISDYLTGSRESSLALLAIPVVILSWVLNLLVSLGTIKVSLSVVDNKKTELADLFNGYPLLVNFLVGSILYGLMVVLGLILFIVPGIYLAIKYHFYSYYIVDKKMGAIEAIKASGKITQGVKLHLILFSLALTGLNILGALALGVGLLITVPVSMLAYALVYRKLSGTLG